MENARAVNVLNMVLVYFYTLIITTYIISVSSENNGARNMDLIVKTPAMKKQKRISVSRLNKDFMCQELFMDSDDDDTSSEVSLDLVLMRPLYLSSYNSVPFFYLYFA